MYKALLLLAFLSVCLIPTEGIKTFQKFGTTYVHTPAGPYRADCVHEIPPGSHVVTLEDKHYILNPSSGRTSQIPICSQDTLPARLGEYDGWLAYTSWNYPKGIGQFLGYFSVPDNPQNDPEVLYVFTGLQNVDWIPIVDPYPPVFDIIQPVLQFPGDNGNYWSVKSWYVTLNSGVLYSREIQTQTGDKIFGNMTNTATDTWYIGGTSQSSGATTSLTVTRNRLQIQPWGYNTLECYGCAGGCSYQPTQPILFTQLKLYDTGMHPITPSWTPLTSPNDICNDKATVNSPSSVTITFGG